MEEYHNLLFPLQGSETSLDHAIDVAKESHAKLYLLHTYRFDSSNGYVSKQDHSLKRSLDEHHWKTLETKYSDKLQRSGIQYELMVEVGFLADRIVYNFREHDIDMVLLSELDASEESIQKKLEELNIPMTFV